MMALHSGIMGSQRRRLNTNIVRCKLCSLPLKEGEDFEDHGRNCKARAKTTLDNNEPSSDS